MTEQEQMKQSYLNYIGNLIYSFKIVEQTLFRNKMAEFVKTIENIKDKDKLKDWNNKMFALVIEYSTLSDKEITEMVSNNLAEFTTRIETIKKTEEK